MVVEVLLGMVVVKEVSLAVQKLVEAVVLVGRDLTVDAVVFLGLGREFAFALCDLFP